LFFCLCGGAPLSAQDRSSLEIPIRYVDSHVYLDLTSDQAGELHLFLDTGTDRSVVSDVAGQKLGVAPLPPRSISRIRCLWHRCISFEGYGSKPKTMEFKRASIRLRSGGSEVYNGKINVMNMKLFFPFSGTRIDGMFGWDIFERWCVRLDYQRRTMTITDPGRCPSLVGANAVALDSRWSHRGAVVLTNIDFTNGRRAKAMLRLDTGNNNFIFLRPKFRQVAGLDPISPSSNIQMGRGVNGDYQSDVVQPKRITLTGAAGNSSFTNSSIVIGRPGSISGANAFLRLVRRLGLQRAADGEIGNGLLEKMIVTYDPLNHKIYFEPRN